MNLLKNLVSSPKDNKKISGAEPAEGICTTCDNRDHCVWLENNKIYCEHFQ